MTTQMEELLQRFGLKDKEIRAFLVMMELGAQPVSVIAKRIKVPRSTMYLILDRLKDVQLIEEFERAGIKYFRCIPARKMMDVIKSQEREIQQTAQILQDKLPELEKMESKLSIRPQVRFFEGKKEIMKLYETIMSRGSFVSYFNPEYVKRLVPEYHFKVPEYLVKYKLKSRKMLVDCPDAYEYKKKFETKNHQVKILPKHMQFNADIVIAGDRIYMFAFDEKNISATEILSPALAESQRVMFDELWKRIK